MLWRERVGITVDESPSFVCPSSVILGIAELVANVPSGCVLTSSDLAKVSNPLPLYVRSSPAVSSFPHDDDASDSGDATCVEVLRVVAAAVKEFGEMQQRQEEEREMARHSDSKGGGQGLPEEGEVLAGAVAASSLLGRGGDRYRQPEGLLGKHLPVATMLALGSIVIISGLVTLWRGRR